MVAIGIDYGTSNSEVTYFDGHEHHHIKLDPLVPDSSKIRSSVFIYYEDELPLPPTEVIEDRVNQLKHTIQHDIEQAKHSYYSAKDPREQERHSDEIRRLQRQLYDRPALQRKAIQLLLNEMSVQDIPLHRLVETGEFAFGEDGFRRFLKTPEKGRLIYSPKNFLGATLDDLQRSAFIGMIAKQLSYFRQCAETQLNQTVEAAVIGRPVRFHGTRGQAGNAQAIDIMRAAAQQAGFEHVDFLEEPIAAAYHLERTADSDITALVVDIGGGTTDICCLNFSPQTHKRLDPEKDVLAVTGKRLGGMECDKNLVLKALAPHLGLGSVMQNNLPVPPNYFADMCAVDDIPTLSRFFSSENHLKLLQTISYMDEPERLERLLIIQEEKLSARVVNSARLAKELLSSKPLITLPLNYIEPDFSVSIELDTLKKSMKTWLSQVNNLITDCLNQSSKAPEALMITGGMSLSPVVLEALTQGQLNGLPLIENEAFNAVCEGLAIQASRWR